MSALFVLLLVTYCSGAATNQLPVFCVSQHRSISCVPRVHTGSIYYIKTGIYHHFPTCIVWNLLVPFGERASKGTIFSLHATKASKSHTHITLVILNLSTSYRYGATFTPKPLYPWEKNNGIHSTGGQSGHSGEEKHLLHLPGFKLQPSGLQPSCYTNYSITVWRRIRVPV